MRNRANMVSEDQDDDVYLSDCESGTSMAETCEQKKQQKCEEFYGTGFVKLDSDETAYKITEKKLVSMLKSSGYDVEAEAMYRNSFSTVMSRARLQTFQIYSRAMKSKCGGNSNEVYAWYGASMQEIRAILEHGFSFPSRNGIHFAHIGKPLYSFLSAAPNPDGLRCMLLCRVILGKSEVVLSDCSQVIPSSLEFDSGVDSLSSPGKYTIWSSHMNTHILPYFMITLKATTPVNKGFMRSVEPMMVPTSDWMPFTKLVAVLSRFLPPDAIQLINKLHGDYKREKMSRREMVEKMRNIVGDKLLLEIIKRYRRRKSCFFATT